MVHRWSLGILVVLVAGIAGVVLAKTVRAPLLDEAVTQDEAAAATSAVELPTSRTLTVSPDLALKPEDLAVLSQQAVDFLSNRQPQWGVAVALPESGTVYEANAQEPFAMASVTKVVIMATLLDEVDDGQHALTDNDRALLTSMITESDNDAAIALWDEVGGAPAIKAFLTKRDVQGITPAGARLSWGDSTATPAGMVQLLAKLWAGQLLMTDSTQLALQLMTGVVSDQRWGVTAGMPDGGTSAAVKDGWYDALTGWRVSSVGIDATGRTPIIMVIMTRNQSTLDDAIDTIEGAAARIGSDALGLPAPEAVEPAARAATAMTRILNPTTGTEPVSGSCQGPSTIAAQEGAWTCTTAAGTLDPCFAGTQAPTTLVCASGKPGQYVPLVLTAPLPSVTWRSDWAHPWLVVLEDGTSCYRRPGPLVNDDGDHVGYDCVDGRVLVGPLQRSETWAALASDANLDAFTTVYLRRVTY